MSRAHLMEHIMEGSRTLDAAALSRFVNEMQNRLATKRQQGRTGWELMEGHQVIDLIRKVMEKQSDTFYVDLSNLLMFCHELEVPPEQVMEQLEAVMGRNWQCRNDTSGACEKAPIRKSIHGLHAPEEVEPKIEPQPRIERAEPEEVETDIPPLHGRYYMIRVDGAACYHVYKYHKPSKSFQQTSRGKLVPQGSKYTLDMVDSWELEKHD